LSATLDDDVFDLAVRTLNYAIEFANTGGYASLRLTDILGGILGVALQMEGVSHKELYREAKERIEERDLLAGGEEKSKFLDELLMMFIEEWRK
jgi:hypothetical protein